ncbi:HEAT repeat domain-containing protein [Pontimicrobium sp. SW4]|uniref:HEAT repeat domain-containing protein n=1 Tax=Pontimicrobium sp. SW4 TaxID=3153519 RepID=A0AAU7BW20_9FLAO
MSLKQYIQNNKNDIDDQDMSFEVDALFEKRLKNEFHKPNKGKLVYLKYISIAACVGLLITLSIQSLNHKKDKTELLANLTNDSAGTRLEGVYHFDDSYKKEDDQIIQTLVKILHNDTNDNVKIATIEALFKFPDNETIRTNLLTALENEKSPLVQIKLIKSLSFLREHRAQKPLKKIIKDKQSIPIVVSNATLAMNNLKL